MARVPLIIPSSCRQRQPEPQRLQGGGVCTDGEGAVAGGSHLSPCGAWAAFQTERLRVPRVGMGKSHPRRMPSEDGPSSARTVPSGANGDPGVTGQSLSGPCSVQGERVLAPPRTTSRSLVTFLPLKTAPAPHCALNTSTQVRGSAKPAGTRYGSFPHGLPAPGHGCSQEWGPVPGTGRERGASGPCWSCSACRSRRSSGPRTPSPRSSRRLGTRRGDRLGSRGRTERPQDKRAEWGEEQVPARDHWARSGRARGFAQGPPTCSASRHHPSAPPEAPLLPVRPQPPRSGVEPVSTSPPPASPREESGSCSLALK